MVQKRAYGMRLRQARQDAGFSQREIVSRLRKIMPGVRGCSFSALRNYEAGTVRHPRREVLEACAQLLGVSRAWLLDGEGQKDPTAEEALALLERAEEEQERLRDMAADDALEQEVAEAFVRDERREVAEREVMNSELLQKGSVRTTFAAAWARLTDGCRDRSLAPEQTNVIGRLLLAQLSTPLAAWGYRHDLAPNGPEFEDYAVALLHALMLAMPRAGRGDLSEDLPEPIGGPK